MALTREEQQLVLKIQGAEDVARLTGEIGKEELAVRDAIRAHASGALSLQSYEAQVTRSSAALEQHRMDLSKAQSATRNYSINVQAAGYALNDFMTANGGLAQQINSVSNNIPNMLRGLGNIGPILSGIVPVVVAIAVSWEGIKKWLGVMEVTVGDHIDRIKERLKELEAKPIKLAVDVHEILNAKAEVSALEAAVDAVNKLSKLVSSAKKESAAAIEKAIAEAPGGGDAVATALRPSFVKDAMSRNQAVKDAEREKQRIEAEAQAKIKEASQAPGSTGLAERGLRKQADALIEAQNELIRFAQTEIAKPGGVADQIFGKMLDGVKSGSERDQKAFADRLASAGMKDLSRTVERSSPAEVERRRAEVEKRRKDDDERDMRKIIAKGEADAVEAERVFQLGKADERHLIRHGEAAAEVAETETQNKKTEESGKELVHQTEERAKAAKEHREQLTKTTEGLGNEFIASAEDRRLEIAQMPEGSKREQRFKAETQRRFEAESQAEVQRRLVAGGVEPGQAAEAANNFGKFLGSDLQRQADLFRQGNPGASRPEIARGLRSNIQANLGIQGDIGEDPRGPGFRSAPKRVHRERPDTGTHLEGADAETNPYTGALRPGEGFGGKPPQGGGLRSVPVSAPQQGPSAADLAQATAGRDGAMLNAVGQQSNAIGSMVARLGHQEAWLKSVANSMAQTNATMRPGRRRG